jgi:hypothetical protein
LKVYGRIAGSAGIYAGVGGKASAYGGIAATDNKPGTSTTRTER